LAIHLTHRLIRAFKALWIGIGAITRSNKIRSTDRLSANVYVLSPVMT
jgi:hypothetical protein